MPISKGNEPNPPQNKMIAVCSAKGGIGKTVITTNLAIALAYRGMRTSILDGCFQFGDVNLAMDLQPKFTIKDAVEQLDHLNDDLILSYLSRHESGVKVLPAPPRPEYADLVTPTALDKITHLLLHKSDFLLVDVLAGLSEQSLYFIEKAHHVLLITDLEMTSLKNTKLILEVLDTLELRHKVQVIVNRATMKSVIQASDVPQILGASSLFYIPNDFDVVSKSLNIGIPFVTNHRRIEISKAIFALAHHIAGQEGNGYIPPKAHFLHLWMQKLRRKKEGVL